MPVGIEFAVDLGGFVAGYPVECYGLVVGLNEIDGAVAADVEAGKTMLGYPAIDAKDALRQWAILKRMVNDSKK